MDASGIVFLNLQQTVERIYGGDCLPHGFGCGCRAIQGCGLEWIDRKNYHAKFNDAVRLVL